MGAEAHPGDGSSLAIGKPTPERLKGANMKWPFKRKDRPADESLVTLLKEVMPPPHHNEFAHRALRGICMTDPCRFFLTVAKPETRASFFDEVWQEVCRMYAEGKQPTFSMADVTVAVKRVGDYPVLLITMPRPEFITQAYMVAIVLKIRFEELKTTLVNALMNGKSQARPEVRYFVLESGSPPGRTVLCEWDAAGEHQNYGDGPPPDPEEFLKAIRARI